MIYTIYQCRDPRDNTIRYVGSTCKSLAERWKNQQWCIRDNIAKGNPLSAVFEWQKELLDAGLSPVYEEVYSEDFHSKLAAHKAEKDVIRSKFMEGHPLTNIAYTGRSPRKKREPFIGPRQPKRNHAEVMKDYWDKPGVREYHSAKLKGRTTKNSIKTVMDGVEFPSRGAAARHLQRTEGLNSSQSHHEVMLRTGEYTEQDIIEFKKMNAERTKRNKAKRKAALAPE